MTHEEMLEKYGDAEVEFVSYYKYSFHFEGKLSDGSIISCFVGGDSDDVYRFNVTAGKKVQIRKLDAPVNSVRVSKDGIEVDYYSFVW